MRKLLLAFVVLSLLMCLCAVAQEAAPPPKYLTIDLEKVKVGHNTAHDAFEASWNVSLKNAGFKTPVLAMTSTTGPNESWWLTGYESLAELEKANEEFSKNKALTQIMDTNHAKDADHIDGSGSIIAKYEPDLSFNPDIRLGEYKMATVNIIRIKAGHSSEFKELVKTMNEARAKAGSPVHVIMYSAMSGDRVGTYYAFVPRKSIVEMDNPEVGKKYDEALGDEGRAKLRQLDDSMGIMVETRMFGFRPDQSVVSTDVAAANPEFWTPKATMAAAKTTAKPKKLTQAAEKK